MFDGEQIHCVTRVKVGGQGEPRIILGIVEEIGSQQGGDDVLLSA